MLRLSVSSTLCGQGHGWGESNFGCDDCERIAHAAEIERRNHLEKQKTILEDQAARIQRRLIEIDRELETLYKEH